MYERTVKLQDDSKLIEVTRDGEYKEIKQRPNNIPEGYSRLNYADFSIVNNDTIRKLSEFITTEELGVIMHMISISDFNSNSLDPLCDDLSIRDKASILKIGKNKVKTITDKLFKLGVFLSIRVYEDQEKVYWVLNPYISWRGKLTKDSLFIHFKDCVVTRLLR